MADKIIDVDSIKNNNTNRVKTFIEIDSQIALYPLYGENNSYDSSETFIFPILPSDIMFTEGSDPTTVKLINWGELPVGMNKKLTTWNFTSFFPARTNVTTYSNSGKRGYVTGNKYKYWFDLSTGTEDPYTYYCSKLLNWKKEQTPLVFFFNMNGWGYYNCQIKNFEFGRKDAIGNVFYQIEFQEYVEYTNFDNGVGNTDYNSDYYYPEQGETILQICKKLYGDSNKYIYFMNLNNMKNPTEIVAGQAYKVR
jgi:hypothetical protein